MKQLQKVNLNQMMTLMILFLTSALATTAKHAGQNVWITLLISGIGGALIITLCYRLSHLHGHKDLAHILRACFGTFLGKVVLLVYACFFFIRTISVGNFMSAMAQQTLMFGANHNVVVLLLIFTITLTSLYGLNAIGRSSEIFLVITVLCLIPFATTVFSSRMFNTENLVPILAEGLPGIAKNTARAFFLPYSELIVFLGIFPYVAFGEGQSNKILKRSYIAIVVSLVLLITMNLITVALLGANLTLNFEYAFYNAMQLAGMNGLLQRLDALAIIIMVVTSYFKLVIYFFVTILTFQTLSKRFKFKWVVAVISVLIFFVSPLIKGSSQFTYETVPFKILPPFTVVIPLIAYLISEAKHRFKKTSTQ